MLELLRQAAEHNCNLVVFPELALTTFFPRWWMTDQDEIDSFFEREMPGNETAPLFNEAQRLGHRLLSAALPRSSGAAALCIVSTHPSWSTARATIAGKYRKIHLPGHAEHEPWRAFQHLEKRYFEVGDLGFGVWKTHGRQLRHVHLQ